MEEAAVLDRQGSLAVNPIRRLRKSIRTHGFFETARLAARMVTRPLLSPLQQWWAWRYLRDSGRRFDRRYGVNTSGWIDGNRLDGGASASHATAYVGMPPKPFRQVMDQLDIDFEEMTFVDFGSGKGRALLLASEYPFARIVGVELSPRLHGIAEDNCRNYRNSAQKCREIISCCSDALQYEIPPQPVLLFFFNPFHEAIMRPIAEKVRESLRRHPRQVFVVYFWPMIRKVWDELDALAAVHVEQPLWAWPAYRGRQLVAVWSTAGSRSPARIFYNRGG